MIRRPPRSTRVRSSAASDVYKRQIRKFRYGDYNLYSPRQTTGLHLTARVGLMYLSKRLLSDLGRNINNLADLKDSDGRTPLSWAAEGGHDAVVKLLLEAGTVDLDSKDVLGWTPLTW